MYKRQEAKGGINAGVGEDDMGVMFDGEEGGGRGENHLTGGFDEDIDRIIFNEVRWIALGLPCDFHAIGGGDLEGDSICGDAGSADSDSEWV